MSESDPKSHWQSLANAVGAEIRPEPESESEPSDETPADTSCSATVPRVPPPVRRERRQPAPPPRRTANHWTSLASELGLEVPAEPEPPEPLVEAVSDPGPALAEAFTVEDADVSDACADVDGAESARDDNEKCVIEPVAPASDSAKAIDNSIGSEDDAREVAWSEPDVDVADEATGSESYVQFERLDSEDVEPRDSEDDEEEPGARRRKRRGRRRRRRRDDETNSSESTEHSADATETIEVVAIGSAELEEIEIVPIEEDEQREKEDESGEDKEPRGRRKRRRGRRGSRRRDDSTAPDDDSECGDASEESDDSDADADETDAHEQRSKHRKIPTWEQTLAGMIDANLKNHAATENSGRRGRGRRGR